MLSTLGATSCECFLLSLGHQRNSSVSFYWRLAIHYTLHYKVRAHMRDRTNLGSSDRPRILRMGRIRGSSLQWGPRTQPLLGEWQSGSHWSWTAEMEPGHGSPGHSVTGSMILTGSGRVTGQCVRSVFDQVLCFNMRIYRGVVSTE